MVARRRCGRGRAQQSVNSSCRMADAEVRVTTRVRRSRCVEHHIHPDGVEGENNQTILGFLQDACVEQRMHVAVRGLDVTTYPACSLADRYRSGADQGANQL